jgi:hypothetical protein
VTLEDGTKKELSDLKQDEFNKLLEQQKTGPKTLEDMARDQLGIDKLILSDVAAIREAVAQGITSPKQIRKGIATTERVTKKTLGAVSGSIDTKDIRDVSEGFLDALGGVVRDFKEGNKSNTDVLSTGLNRFADTLDASQKNFAGILKEIGVKISSTKGNQTGVENIISSKVEEVSKYYTNPTSSAPISSLITNKVGALQNTQNNAIAQTTNSKIDIGGKLEINVNAPAGISTEQLKQSFDTAFNSNSFKDYIVRVASPTDSNREPISKTYSA